MLLQQSNRPTNIAVFCMFWGLLMLAISPAIAQKTTPPAANKIITGTILLNERKPLDAKSILESLRTEWKIRTDSFSIADKTIVCAVPGATLMIAYLDYPVSSNDIKATAQISWLWPRAAEEATRHQAQAVISVIGLPEKSLELHKLFTKVAAAVLGNTQSSGVYMSGQYILLSKGFYSSAAHNLVQGNTVPLYCWVYFGMNQDKDGSSGYTYGLPEFGLSDMEILHSKHTIQEVHAALYDVADALLPKKATLKDGESITLPDDTKVTAHTAKPTFLTEGKVLKLEY